MRGTEKSQYPAISAHRLVAGPLQFRHQRSRQPLEQWSRATSTGSKLLQVRRDQELVEARVIEHLGRCHYLPIRNNTRNARTVLGYELLPRRE
jgi:hypothetical protein